jgi:hypothetical protein
MGLFLERLRAEPPSLSMTLQTALWFGCVEEVRVRRRLEKLRVRGVVVREGKGRSHREFTYRLVRPDRAAKAIGESGGGLARAQARKEHGQRRPRLRSSAGLSLRLVSGCAFSRSLAWLGRLRRNSRKGDDAGTARMIGAEESRHPGPDPRWSRGADRMRKCQATYGRRSTRGREATRERRDEQRFASDRV